jgi:hypothetical protein
MIHSAGGVEEGSRTVNVLTSIHRYCLYFKFLVVYTYTYTFISYTLFCLYNSTNYSGHVTEPKFKIAAMNRKYIYKTYILGCIPDKNEIPTWVRLDLGNPSEQHSNIVLIAVQKAVMRLRWCLASSVSLVPSQIHTKFWWLPPHYRCEQSNETTVNIFRCNPKWKIHDGGLETYTTHN